MSDRQTRVRVPARPNDGVFRANRRRPIHRWYPFIEGYSADLVERALSHGGRRRKSIFDPFGGSGTTALAAASLGHASTFAEVNPYLAWLTDVKVNKSRAGAGSPAELSRLGDFARAINEIKAPRHRLDHHPLLRVDGTRQFFPRGVAEQVVSLLDTIDTEFTGWARDLARLAVTTALVPASNMIRRTDLRRRTNRDAPPSPLKPLVSRKLLEIVDDTKEFASQIFAETQLLGTDARGPYAAHDPFDLVVTSPPYLNGTNYCRNSKLELFALGYIDAEADLRDLRARSLAAGINNVSSRTKITSEIAVVESLAGRLDVASYDARIGRMVRAYFNDMQRVFTQLRNECRDGAELWLDIGDSKYSGIHVDTPAILTKIAVRSGWRLRTREMLRQRRSHDGSALTQQLLMFVTA